MAEPPGLFALLGATWASVSQGQMPDGDVIKTLISKLLGFAIMAGACGVKLPQISIIMKNKSAEGLSALSVELEILCFLIHGAYGYMSNLPFNLYGEMVILASQTSIILALLYKYAKTPIMRVLAVTSLFVGFIGVVVSGQAPMVWIETAFSANTLVNMASRLPQIYKNFQEQSTGQLSIVTASINVVGGLVRIFTTIQENAGATMLRQFVIGFILNATILSQIIFYGNKDAKAKVVKETAKEAKKLK